MTSDPVSVSFGRTLWPHDDDAPVTRTVTYRNAGRHRSPLNLTVEVTGPGGAAAPAGLFRFGTDRLTVPAGGTAARSTVTVDTRLGGPDGYWTGRVVARSGDVAVAVTPLAVNREVESYDAHRRHLDRDRAAHRRPLDHLVGMDTYGSLGPSSSPTGWRTVRLPKGQYGLTASLRARSGRRAAAGVGHAGRSPS